MTHQRVVRGGEVVHHGSIDTLRLFERLTHGFNFKGKSVLDVGCNVGEMSRLATEAGATTHGIDKNIGFIEQAQQLNPGLSFTATPVEKACGSYDVALASAVFHYVADHRHFFSQLARVAKLLIMDVWLHEQGGGPSFVLTKRGMFIPNEAAFMYLAKEFWQKIESHGPSLSPDGSKRTVFWLSEPLPNPASAVVVYGPGRSGKTTYACSLVGYEHLQLDQLFLAWRRFKHRGFFSVSGFVDRMFAGDVGGRGFWEVCGSFDEWFAHDRQYIQRWLQARRNLDVVVEGYHAVYTKYRDMVITLLQEQGWGKILQVERGIK